jgi:hypothetical protein
MVFLFKVWKIANKAYVFVRRIISLKECFKIELQKDTIFSDIFVCKFIRNLIDINEHKRKKENLPTNKRLEKIGRGWAFRIDIL